MGVLEHDLAEKARQVDELRAAAARADKEQRHARKLQERLSAEMKRRQAVLGKENQEATAALKVVRDKLGSTETRRRSEAAVLVGLRAQLAEHAKAGQSVALYATEVAQLKTELKRVRACVRACVRARVAC